MTDAITNLDARLARMEEILADAAAGQIRSIEVLGDDPFSSIEAGLNIVLEDLRQEIAASADAARNLEAKVAERTADLEEQLRVTSHQKDLILRQRETIVELSTPVLSLWEGVLALPVIGEVDTRRGAQITKRVLEAIIERQADVVIFDVTGVPMVDTQTTQRLVQTMDAAALLGARCVLSGVRPEVAIALVSVGVDLSRIKACATLAAALEHAIQLVALARGVAPTDEPSAPAPGEREAPATTEQSDE